MSASREASLWRWLAQSRRDLRGELHLQRVENTAASGTPDVEGALNGAEPFWIELKAAARPRDGGPVRVKVRDAQVEWLRRRCGVQAFAWVLVQVGTGRSAERYLLWGTEAARLRRGTMTEAHLAKMCELRRYANFDPSRPADVIRRAAGRFI